MLILSNLTKRFGSHTVLNDINYSFAANALHGIIGVNGAGKTTFFNCISNNTAFTGSIKSTLKHNTIAYLPTLPYFFPKSTGNEYLSYISLAKRLPLTHSNYINLFQLPLNELIETYSTGMQKKIAFTGILIGTYGVYLFDEPFNGVDLQSNITLRREIMKIKTENTIVLISSHILSSLTEMCDYIHLLKNGVFYKVYTPDTFNQIEHDLLNT